MDSVAGSSGHQQVIFQNENITAAAAENQGQGGASAPVQEKRRPGRPKGSGKKYPDGAPPKIKRPVGRPRKDGFPAGSVNPPRPSRKPTQNDSAVLALIASGNPYLDVKRPMFQSLQDPNFDGEDWMELSRSKPGVFINTLIGFLAEPNPVSPAGTVEDAFKTHLGSLVSPRNQSQSLPSLYSVLRTFWLPMSPTYFCLTGANTSRPLLEFRFLYWDPQPLVFNGISCPSCTTPLINKGRITSGPVKIYDLERPFFVIGCEYVCNSPACMSACPEGRKFASTDPAIFRSLPNTLAEEFPARLRQFEGDLGSGPEVWNWQAIGVSKALWNMVQGSLRSGVRKEVILQIISSIQHGVAEPTTLVAEEEEEEEPQEQNQMIEDTVQHPPMAQGTPAEYAEAWKAHAGHSASAEPDTPSVAGSSAGPGQAYMYPQPQPQPQPQGGHFSSAFRVPPYFAPSAKVGQSSSSAVANSVTTTGPSNPNPISPPPPLGNEPPNPPAKRAYPFLDEESGSVDGPRKRNPRHCSKCGSADCKGKGGRSFCLNACRDCGKVDCYGRTNRRNVCANRGWGT
ncbi:hypothetical protein ARMSODRAFT_958712 [Armillaria solidipes]|uniref:Post-SET domain-containing protein n=1 Tax=Armillaria solidipes TaxID=1076256 RepID=A0A2H3BA24_9AGAR|nr:hypothetical protein ARMSODRAFT_958712 [Armillaria solidipes]